MFPGGLGLRELLSSAVGPAVGMSAAVATVVAAVERIVSLAVVAVMALVIDDQSIVPSLRQPDRRPTAATSPESATCA